MENPEKQKHTTQETLSSNTRDKILELEKQIEQMRVFVQVNEPHSNESEDLKNKVDHFKEEVKRLRMEMLQLKLKQRNELSSR